MTTETTQSEGRERLCSTRGNRWRGSRFNVEEECQLRGENRRSSSNVDTLDTCVDANHNDACRVKSRFRILDPEISPQILHWGAMIAVRNIWGEPTDQSKDITASSLCSKSKKNVIPAALNGAISRGQTADRVHFLCTTVSYKLSLAPIHQGMTPPCVQPR